MYSNVVLKSLLYGQMQNILLWWTLIHFPSFWHLYSLLTSILLHYWGRSLKKKKRSSKMGKQKQSIKSVWGLLQYKTQILFNCNLPQQKTEAHHSLMPCLNIALVSSLLGLDEHFHHSFEMCTDVSLITINHKIAIQVQRLQGPTYASLS